MNGDRYGGKLQVNNHGRRLAGVDEWLNHEDALTMLVRDLAVQLEDMAGQLDQQVRVQTARVNDVASQVASLHRQRTELADAVARLASRCDAAVGKVGDLVDQRFKAEGFGQQLDALKSQADRLEAALIGGAERRDRELEALKVGQAKLAGETQVQRDVVESLRERWASLEGRVRGLGTQQEEFSKSLEVQKERITFAEGLAGSAGNLQDRCTREFDRHALDLEAHKASVQERLAAHFERLAGDIGSLRDKQVRELESHKACVQERLSYVEGAVGEMSMLREKHAEESGAHKALQASMSREFNERNAQACALSKRLDALERCSKEFADTRSAQAQTLEEHEMHHVILAKEVKAHEMQRSALADRLEALDRFLADSNGLAKEAEARKALEAFLHERLGALESTWETKHEQQYRVVEACRTAHIKLTSELKAQTDVQFASVTHHVDRVAKDMIDRHDTQAQSIQLHLSSHADAMRRLGSCEEQGKSSAERLERLERDVGFLSMSTDDSSAKRIGLTGEFRALKDHMEKQVVSLNEQLENNLTTLHDQVERSIAELIQRQDLYTNSMDLQKVSARSVADRLDRLEKTLGDSAEMHERHLKALEATKAVHDRLADATAARQSDHSTLSERMSCIERLAGNSAEKHGCDLEQAHGKLAELVRQLGEERSVREAQASSSSALLRAHAEWSHEKAAMADRYAALAQRLSLLERTHGEESSRHVLELEGMKAARSQQAQDLEAMKADHGRQKVDMEAFRVTRDAHEKDLRAFTLVHSAQAQDLALLRRSREQQQVSIVCRLDAAERALKEYAEAHAQDMRFATGQIDEIRATEREARHELQQALVALLRRESGARASLQQKSEVLDRKLAETGEKYTKTVEDFARETRLVWEAIDGHTHEMDEEARANRPPSRKVPLIEGPRVEAAALATRATTPTETSGLASPRQFRRIAALATPRIVGSQLPVEVHHVGSTPPAPLLPFCIVSNSSLVATARSTTPGRLPARPSTVVASASPATMPAATAHLLALAAPPVAAAVATASADVVCPSSTDVFKQIDLNGDGVIDRAEFAQAFMPAGFVQPGPA